MIGRAEPGLGGSSSGAGSAEAAALDAEIGDVIARGPVAPLGDNDFSRLALRLASHQAAECAPLRDYWTRRGFQPAAACDWREIPPVPSALFKRTRVATFPPARTVAEYRSSGTTGAERSVHAFESLELYRAASLQTYAHFVMCHHRPLALLALAPSPSDAPDSSLSAMLGFIASAPALTTSATFCAPAGQVDVAAAVRWLSEAESASQPVVVFGTAFAFVHLCDALASLGFRFQLPPGSRAVETGGFKGRSRAVERSELVHMISDRLGLPLHLVLNEYGMSELSSQLYTTSAILPLEPQGWLGPSWVRVRCLHPRTGADLPPGELGVIALVDLANRGSAVAVRTADLGWWLPDGRLFVQGRSAAVESRGCSLAFDWAPPSAALPALPAASARPPAGPIETLTAAASALIQIGENARAEALQMLGHHWLDPDFGPRQKALQLVPQETGIHPEVFRHGLDSCFQAWLAPSWQLVLEREWPQRQRAVNPALVGILAAGNVPTPVAWDVGAALLAGAAAVVRPSSHSQHFAAIFAESLTALGAPFRGAMHLLQPADPHAWQCWAPHFDAAILNGSDATVREYAIPLRVGTPTLARGSRTSVGLIWPEPSAGPQVLESLAASFALDIAAWDQRGCLSPTFCFVREPLAHSFALALESALAELQPTWPRGELGGDDEVALLEARDNAVVGAVAGQMDLVGTYVALVRTESSDGSAPNVGLLSPVAGRFVWVVPAHDLLALPLDWLGGARLSTVASHVANPDHATTEPTWRRALIRAGASRFCELGNAQNPSLSWYHDGAELVRPLLKYAAGE